MQTIYSNRGQKRDKPELCHKISLSIWQRSLFIMMRRFNFELP